MKRLDRIIPLFNEELPYSKDCWTHSDVEHFTYKTFVEELSAPEEDRKPELLSIDGQTKFRHVLHCSSCWNLYIKHTADLVDTGRYAPITKDYVDWIRRMSPNEIKKHLFDNDFTKLIDDKMNAPDRESKNE